MQILKKIACTIFKKSAAKTTRNSNFDKIGNVLSRIHFLNFRSEFFICFNQTLLLESGPSDAVQRFTAAYSSLLKQMDNDQTFLLSTSLSDNSDRSDNVSDNRDVSDNLR